MRPGREQEGMMLRGLIWDSVELVGLGAFLMMIAMVAQAAAGV
jgi:hypothetical protein